MNKNDVMIGATVVRRAACALNKFMKNQEEIQDIYPQSRLVIATDEPDFEEELKELLKTHGVEGDVITYKTEKPDYARGRDWSITAGREAVRKYVLKTDAEYLLWLDADMTADPLIISIMKKEIEGYDVVQSGYQDRSDCRNRLSTIGFGVGCFLIKRNALEKIKFKCYELKHQNRQPLDDEMVFELDLFRIRAKIKKGVFLSINHHSSNGEMVTTNPQNLTLFQKIRASFLFRYILITLCITLGYDLNVLLRPLVYRAICFKRRINLGIGKK